MTKANIARLAELEISRLPTVGARAAARVALSRVRMAEEARKRGDLDSAHRYVAHARTWLADAEHQAGI